MSAFEQAQLTLRSLLARGLAAREVARLSRLDRASEVWGGATPLDRPAWYLWLADTAGAYRLELEDAAAFPDNRCTDAAREASTPEQGWHARLSVRYYPSPDEPGFSGFSAEERQVVVGDFLDATGTPRIELADRISPHLFVVGSLEWAEGADRLGTGVAVSALDRLRVVGRGRAALDRDVPAWALSTRLSSALAGVQAQLHRQVLERVVLSRRSGFELVDQGAEGLVCRDTEELIHGEAVLGFAARSAAGAGDALVEALLDPAAVVVADERFGAGCRHPPGLEGHPRIPLAVTHAWFGGAAHVESGLTCSC